VGYQCTSTSPWPLQGSPPINWGDPQTWERFWWVVSARLYRDAPFGLAAQDLPRRLAAWASLLLEQYGWWGWLLEFLDLWRLRRRDSALLLVTLYLFLAYSAFSVTFDRADSYVHLLPVSVAVALWIGNGALELISYPRTIRRQAGATGEA